MSYKILPMIAPCSPSVADTHGTAVASIVAGNYPPAATYDFEDGHAPAASLINENLGLAAGCIPPDLYNSIYLPSWSLLAKIHANGFGTQKIGCSPTGPEPYCAGAEQTDRFVWDHKDFLITIGAGNEGAQEQLGNIRCQAQAKNLISVGASWNGMDANKMANYSSRGPACDGRLKPTLVAPGGGSNTVSPLCVARSSCTNPLLCPLGCDGDEYNRYVFWSGTSFAHPAVAGSAALVRQYFTEGWYPTGTKVAGNALSPSAALIKAVVINGAVEMTDASAYEECIPCQECPPPGCQPVRKYPNKVQGWGRVLLDNSLFFAGDSRKLTIFDESIGFGAAGEEKEYRIQVTDSALPLEATLVWSDYPGAVGASPSLVNNLNLVVRDPSCSVFNGNNFWEGQSITGGSSDTLNVEEAVWRTSPALGVWSVSIRAANIVNATQPFALAVTGGTGSVLANPPRVTAAGEHLTGLETIVSGSYLSTRVSDNVYEVLKEVDDGVSVLEHVWRFDNVPLGSCLTLNIEGHRPTNPENDNFKFSWSQTLNGPYTDIPNAVIDKNFEPVGGINYPFAWTGTSGTIYIKISDTQRNTGWSLDTVKIDRLEIR